MNAPNSRPIKNVELIEIVVKNTNNSKWSFPINENLRGKKITGIETFKLANVAKSPVGNALINATAVKDAFVTINSGGKEVVKDVPLSSFDASNNNGLIKNFDSIEVDTQKSYISFSQIANLVANEAIILAFYYE